MGNTKKQRAKYAINPPEKPDKTEECYVKAEDQFVVSDSTQRPIVVIENESGPALRFTALFSRERGQWFIKINPWTDTPAPPTTEEAAKPS